MKTLEQSLSNHRRAVKGWRVSLVLACVAIFAPMLADSVLDFDVTMALSFSGLVVAPTSYMVMLVYKRRLQVIASIANGAESLAQWLCEDRYDFNKGQPTPASFSRSGFFYGGQPYCVYSYDCQIKSGRIIDDEGPALSITYTVPSTRNGLRRHKSVVNIPVPEGELETAHRLAEFYSAPKV